MLWRRKPTSTSSTECCFDTGGRTLHTLPIFEELLGTLGDLRVAYLALLGYLDVGLLLLLLLLLQRDVCRLRQLLPLRVIPGCLDDVELLDLGDVGVLDVLEFFDLGDVGPLDFVSFLVALLAPINACVVRAAMQYAMLQRAKKNWAPATRAEFLGCTSLPLLPSWPWRPRKLWLSLRAPNGGSCNETAEPSTPPWLALLALGVWRPWRTNWDGLSEIRRWRIYCPR